MADTRIDTSPAEAAASRRFSDRAAPLLALGAVVIGLLPWLTTGMRLPLQNLWAQPTDPGDMPIALLPFSQYSLTVIFSVLLIGGALTGMAARALRPRMTRAGLVLLLCTTPALQVIAVAQSATVTGSGLEDSGRGALYLTAIVGVSVLSLLLGLLAQTLIALAPRAGALLGLTLSAIAAPSWLGGFLRPLTLQGSDWLLPAMSLLAWIAPVLTGISIAWAGVRSAGRVAAAIASLLLLWIAPAAITGISSAAGSRVLASDPLAMIEYALQVFASALVVPELALRPVVAAIVVAALGLLVLWAVRRRRRPASS